VRKCASGSSPAPAGVWLPEAVAGMIPKHQLGCDSVWRVYLTILFVQYRYGGEVAYLTTQAIAERTGLSVPTVKRAVSHLLASGLCVRPKRNGALKVTLTDAGRDDPQPPQPKNRGISLVIPPRDQLSDPSPTSLYSSSLLLSRGEGGTFSKAQTALIDDVLRESSELLGHDVRDLALPDPVATQLHLPAGTTYDVAIEQLLHTSDKRGAGILTRAVLALRNDPRVQGNDLAAQ
jgi:hypothetical protein